MKKNKIALFSCAALVAAGIGLNIQNALADYGIGENSFSLVAGPGSNSGSNSNSNSNSNGDSEKVGCFKNLTPPDSTDNIWIYERKCSECDILQKAVAASNGSKCKKKK